MYSETDLMWRISTGENVVLVLPCEASKYKKYMITTEAQLKIALKMLDRAPLYILKIFDQNGHLVEMHEGKGKAQEVTMDNVEAQIAEIEEYEDMISQMDKEIKHQQDLKKRREKRQQKKKEKGERL